MVLSTFFCLGWAGCVIHLSYSLDEVLPKFHLNFIYFLLFAMSQFDWRITIKKLKLWRLPQNRRFY